MIIFAIPPSGELKLALVVNSRQGSQTDFGVGKNPKINNREGTIIRYSRVCFMHIL